MTDKLEKVNIVFHSGNVQTVKMSEETFLSLRAVTANRLEGGNCFFHFPNGGVYCRDISMIELLK